MASKPIKVNVLEGENFTLVAQLRHNDKRLLLLGDVTTWGISIHRVGESALPIYSLQGQSPTIAMFENDTASVSSVSVAVGATDQATFTRASGSWIDDRYFAGLSMTASGYSTEPEANATWVIVSVTELVLTVVDTGNTIDTPDTGGTVVLTDASARDSQRLINDDLWELGGETPGHNMQFTVNMADISPNKLEGNRTYEVTFEWDASDVAGKVYGDEFAQYHVKVASNQVR